MSNTNNGVRRGWPGVGPGLIQEPKPVVTVAAPPVPQPVSPTPAPAPAAAPSEGAPATTSNGGSK